MTADVSKLTDELFELFKKHNPDPMMGLGVCFSMACVCAHLLGLNKLEAQKLFVKLWDEGAKDLEVAEFKRESGAHARSGTSAW